MQHQTSLFRGQPDTEAIKLIQYWEPHALSRDQRGYCVCTSEGKDSRVLGHLMRRAGVKHFYVHSITGIDPPELVYFQRRQFRAYEDTGYTCHDVMYDMSFWDLMVKKRIPPFRTRRYCCEYLKERKVPLMGDAILSFGVRKFESVRRAAQRDELEMVDGKTYTIFSHDNDEKRRTFETCMANGVEKRLNPIAYWTDAMVWDYSRDIGLEQCSLYAEGFERLGCIGCPMAGEQGRRKEFDRWPEFERLYRWAFQRMWQGRVDAGLPVLGHTQDPDEWFDWWMSDRGADAPDENQMELEL